MSFVDESLLSKLVGKFGVDKEDKGPTKMRLWAKVTKEYNSITGNSHTKARLNKKWQNIKHQRKLKRQKLYENHILEAMTEQDASEDTSKSFISYSDVGENMWNVMDYAFRDLFLYLVKKYDVDEVTNPRIKNELWKNISKEFHEISENMVTIKHEKFTKKWQNMKQYNKSKQKTHPLMDETIDLDFDVIKEKIRKVRERAKIDQNFAAFLNRESDDLTKMEGGLSKTTLQTEERIMLNSSSVNSLSNKQLEREVYMEALRYEQEKFRVLIENGQLEKDKLQREVNWMEIQLQLAQTELALKKQACQEKGIIIQ